jgi:hypothetical protein
LNQKGFLMNKAITDGVVFMPPAFGDGLDVWSSEDGIPGSATYDLATNATLVAADADFGTCLEMVKTDTTQKLRYTGETPMLAGCYLRVSVRVKAMSGPLPSVRIAGWAGGAGGGHVTGVDETGPVTALSTYGEVITITAIVGSGARTGVDMPWGRVPIFGHFGLDLTGSDGGVIRIEDISIEDVTSVFYRKMMDIVDVRDYGAIGDGVTVDTAAFEAADAAAAGRDILVPEGVFFLDQTVTIAARIRFEGTIVMPGNAILSLTQNFDYPTYVDAFGDEKLAFTKALQALFNYTDHESLDLGGRRIELDGPIDVHAAVGNQDSYSSRRVIRNGQLNATSSAAWDDDVVTSSASYTSTNATTLSNVLNIASIPVGALVTGTGVGREVHVRAVNIPAQSLTLSQPLWGATASQTYTFTRHKYLLDFSGFTKVSRFIVENIDFACNNRASGLMLAPDGLIFHVKDCFFTSPKDRGLTSIGIGCAGLGLDRNQFLSSEQSMDVADRRTIAFNVNASDTKIRNNRGVRFKHFGVMNGSGHIISGNHFFQGDITGDGTRSAGLILTENNCKSTFTANYVDNCYLEWTNEHDATPDLVVGLSFGALAITNNIFMSGGSVPWFSWIQATPYGTGHYINGCTITGNVFKHINGAALDRAEKLDTTYADFAHNRHANFNVSGNTYYGVSSRMQNPVTLKIVKSSVDNTWNQDISDHLPFGSWAQVVTAMVPQGAIKNGAGGTVFTQPYAQVSQGVSKSEINLKWSETVSGAVRCTVRCDNPKP